MSKEAVSTDTIRVDLSVTEAEIVRQLLQSQRNRVDMADALDEPQPPDPRVGVALDAVLQAIDSGKPVSRWQKKVEELRWQKIEVPSDGYVCLVDAMGDESAIVQAARVSYGAGTKTPSDDRSLIRHLMRNRHTTPLEMVELKFLIRVPMDTWRQWIRHRTASVNEYSTRYSQAIDSQNETLPDEWRLQSGLNKQGSDGMLHEWPEGWKVIERQCGGQGEQHWNVFAPDSIGDTAPVVTIPVSELGTLEPRNPTPGEVLTHLERKSHSESADLYKLRLALGVAREQARKDLPLSTYTEAYWKIDLHNLLHFLGLRMDSHAQLEIRQFANAIGQIVYELYPTVWDAFLSYRMNAVTISEDDSVAIKAAIAGDFHRFESVFESMGKTERVDCLQKMAILGISAPSKVVTLPG